MTLRRATPEDFDAVAELVLACDLADAGQPDTTAEDLREEWSYPGWESWVAEDGDGAVVAYAWLWERRPGLGYTDVYVHPRARGGDLYPRLLAATESRARERGFPRLHAFAVGPDEGPRGALARAGFAPVRYELRMAIALDAPPPAPDWPDGIAVRRFEQGEDGRVFHEALNEAFRDEWNYEPEPFERWRERLVERDTFDPALWLLALERDEPAGVVAAFREGETGWVQGLGVRPRSRGRGLGLALLHAAFAALWERGARRVELNVDAESLTGATRLYRRAGMHEAFRIDRYEKVLATL